MGVRYITNFVSENASDLLESTDIAGLTLIIDGYNILHEIYYSSEAETSYGGDYDVFADAVKLFCSNLKARNIAPYFVFDGASELNDYKFKTLLDRARERIHLASLSTQRKRAKILPSLAFRTCVDALIEQNIPFTICDHEADAQLASLAYQMNCPLVSNDSDFLLHDLPGGVISVHELDVPRLLNPGGQSFNVRTLAEIDEEEPLIVRMYNIRRVMQRYKIEDVSLLSVLSLICGNDTFDPDRLFKFRKHINSKGRTMEVKIYLNWLSKHTDAESAIDVIVKFQKASKHLEQKMMDVVNSYKIQSCHIDEYFLRQTIEHGEEDHELYSHLPDAFWVKYRASAISKKFLEIMLFKRRIFSVQMERLTNPSTWRCSTAIRLLTYRILSASSLEPISTIKEYDRHVKRLVYFDIEVPTDELQTYSISELYQSSEEYRLTMFYEMLGITDQHLRKGVVSPGSENQRENDILTALTLHWVNNAEPGVTSNHLMALLVCIIDLSLIKDYVPITSPVRQKTGRHNTTPTRDQNHSMGLELDIIHAISQFQAVLSDGLDLLGLLGIETGIHVHHILSCRYIYNLCMELSTRTNPQQYCEDLLIEESEHGILFTKWYQLIVESVNPGCLLPTPPPSTETPTNNKKIMKTKKLSSTPKRFQGASPELSGKRAPRGAFVSSAKSKSSTSSDSQTPSDISGNDSGYGRTGTPGVEGTPDKTVDSTVRTKINFTQSAGSPAKQTAVIGDSSSRAVPEDSPSDKDSDSDRSSLDLEQLIGNKFAALALS